MPTYHLHVNSSWISQLPSPVPFQPFQPDLKTRHSHIKNHTCEQGHAYYSQDNKYLMSFTVFTVKKHSSWCLTIHTSYDTSTYILHHNYIATTFHTHYTITVRNQKYLVANPTFLNINMECKKGYLTRAMIVIYIYIYIYPAIRW